MSGPEGATPAGEYNDSQRIAAQELGRQSVAADAELGPVLSDTLDPHHLVGENRGDA